MIIYLVHNNINGKNYIGKTKNNLTKRWKEHCQSFLNGSVCHFYSAIKKYGCNNFSRRILNHATTIEELNKLEKYYIKQLNTHSSMGGYNMTWGGDGGPIRLGMKGKDITKKRISEKLMRNKNGRDVVFTEERKNKISAKLKNNKNCLGYKLDEEHKKNISKRMQGNTNGIGNRGPRGRILSEQERKNRSDHMKRFWDINKGKIFRSEETKQKIRKKRKLQIITDEHKRKISESMKKYYQNVRSTII